MSDKASYDSPEPSIPSPQTVQDQSFLKVHFTVTNLTLGDSKLYEVEADVVQDFENNVGPVQKSFVRATEADGVATVLIGLCKDEDAIRFWNSGGKLDRSCEIVPIDIFQRYLSSLEQSPGKGSGGILQTPDQAQETEALLPAPMANSTPPEEDVPSPKPSRSRTRSRSPRPSAIENSLSLLIVCPPLQCKDSDILQELSRHKAKEVPKIEYIFTNIEESGCIIKLLFTEQESVEFLVQQDVELRNKPVLVMEPSSLDYEKSVKHALSHYQVRVSTDDMTVTNSQLESLLTRFGKVADLANQGDDFIITFTKHSAARDLKNERTVTFQNANFDQSELQISGN